MMCLLVEFELSDITFEAIFLLYLTKISQGLENPINSNRLMQKHDKISFQEHKAISSAHGYPTEQPSIEFAVGLIKSSGISFLSHAVAKTIEVLKAHSKLVCNY